MKALLVPCLVLIASCATQPVSAPLPCPDPLVIARAEPDVKARINELRRTDAEGGSQIDRDMYEFFKRRADLQAARRARLQEICRSTYEAES